MLDTGIRGRAPPLPVEDLFTPLKMQIYAHQR